MGELCWTVDGSGTSSVDSSGFVDTVHLRWVDPSHLADRIDLLDRSELGRLDGLASHRRRAGFVAGRALLKTLLAELTGEPAASISLGLRCSVCGGEHGKPYVAGPDGEARMPISISHANGIVLVAAGGPGPLGVDVTEIAATDFDGFDRVALTAAETASLPTDGSPRLIARAIYWSRKEAALKAVGTGLATDISRVEVTQPRQAPAVRSWELDIPPGQVLLRDLALPTGYRGSAAVRVEP